MLKIELLRCIFLLLYWNTNTHGAGLHKILPAAKCPFVHGIAPLAGQQLQQHAALLLVLPPANHIGEAL